MVTNARHFGAFCLLNFAVFLGSLESYLKAKWAHVHQKSKNNLRRVEKRRESAKNGDFNVLPSGSQTVRIIWTRE